MLPVEGQAAGMVCDGEVGISDATATQCQRLLVDILDPAGVQLVRDDQLRLRPYEVAAFGAADQPVFQEP